MIWVHVSTLFLCSFNTSIDLLATIVVVFSKAVVGCYLTFFPFTYGRKKPKYQKKPVKAGLLTLYVGKSINLQRD